MALCLCNALFCIYCLLDFEFFFLFHYMLSDIFIKLLYIFLLGLCVISKNFYEFIFNVSL